MVIEIFNKLLKAFPNHYDLAFNIVAVLYGYRSATLIQSIDYTQEKSIVVKDIQRDEYYFYNSIKSYAIILIDKHNHSSSNKVATYEYGITRNPHFLIYSKSIVEPKYQRSLELILVNDSPLNIDIGTVLGYIEPDKCTGYKPYSITYYIEEKHSLDKKLHHIYAEVCIKKPSISQLDRKKAVLNELSQKLGYDLVYIIEEITPIKRLIELCSNYKWCEFSIYKYEIINYLWNSGFHKSVEIIEDCDIKLYKKYRLYWKVLLNMDGWMDEKISPYCPFTPKVDAVYKESISQLENKIYMLIDTEPTTKPVSEPIIKKNIYKTITTITKKLDTMAF
tara:strand:- start:551 stop:1555 length:1005 start_codon:yes stop_codon:yes gene_type:complete